MKGETVVLTEKDLAAIGRVMTDRLSDIESRLCDELMCAVELVEAELVRTRDAHTEALGRTRTALCEEIVETRDDLHTDLARAKDECSGELAQLSVELGADAGRLRGALARAAGELRGETALTRRELGDRLTALDPGTGEPVSGPGTVRDGTDLTGIADRIDRGLDTLRGQIRDACAELAVDILIANRPPTWRVHAWREELRDSHLAA